MQFKLDRTTRLHLLLIVAATFLAFGLMLGGYFIADDTWQLQFAYRVMRGDWSLVTGNFVHSYLSLPSMDFYRPLLGLSYLADYALYGANAAGFYLSNVLMAALSAIILYFLAKALVPAIPADRANALALISALLFTVSPLHCEDICWISGRADLLAAPLYLGAMLLAIYARDWQTNKINYRYYVLSLLAFVLSLMSKESAVTLPLVVAALFVLCPTAPASISGLLQERLGQAGHGSDRPEGGGPFSDGKDQPFKKRKKIRKTGPKKEAQDSPLLSSADRAEVGKITSYAPPIKNTKDKDIQVKDIKEDQVKSKIAFWPWFRNFVFFLAPYGILTILYLFVRQRALGSFIGGYTGNMGAALSKWIMFRWLDPTNLFRLAFPISKYNFHIFGLSVERTPAIAIFGTIYAIILAVLLIRLLTQKLDLRLPFFLVLWLLASIVPLINLWGMDGSLHNQRVLYLFTAPMVMMLPALIFLPKLADRPSMQKQFFELTPTIEAFLREIAAWMFYALTVCLIVISALTSYNWVLAGLQIKGIKEKTVQLIDGLSHGPDKKILLVCVPKDYLGAHVLMGNVNLMELLEPPLNPQHVSQYVVGFQRALVGPAEPVSSDRLKSEIASLHEPRAYFWDVDRGDYNVVKYDRPQPGTPESINLPVATSAAQVDKAGFWYPQMPQKSEYKILDGVPYIELHHLADLGGDGLVITGLDINPLAFDFVHLSVALTKAPPASGVYLSFDDKEDAKAPFIEEPQVCKILQVNTVRPGEMLKKSDLSIRVSHFGQWYNYKKIRRMKISFSNLSDVAVSQVSISTGRALVPLFTVVGRGRQPNGEYFCDNKPINFFADVGQIKDAKSCQVEISTVNQSWDIFMPESMEDRDHVLGFRYNVPLKDGKAFFQLDPRIYAETGFYDVRIAAVNDKNEMVSDWSDLITLYQLDPEGARAPYCADY